MRTALILPIVLAATAAAESKVAGPSVGYVFDKSANNVRRIAGITGASSFDAPVAIEGFRPLAVSSPAGYVVGVNDDGSVSLVVLKTMERVAMPASSPDQAILSASGAAVALIWKETNRIQVFRGLPDKPAATSDLQLPGTPSISAVSDSGSQALVAVHAEDSDTLYSVSQVVTPLQTGSQITAVAYGRGGEAFFTDASALYRASGGNVERIADAGAAHGIAVFRNSVVVARSAGALVVSLSDLSTTEVNCGCAVTMLSPLGQNVFQVTDAMDAPVWILDMNASDPAFYFIANAGGSDE